MVMTITRAAAGEAVEEWVVQVTIEEVAEASTEVEAAVISMVAQISAADAAAGAAITIVEEAMVWMEAHSTTEAGAVVWIAVATTITWSGAASAPTTVEVGVGWTEAATWAAGTTTTIMTGTEEAATWVTMVAACTIAVCEAVIITTEIIMMVAME